MDWSRVPGAVRACCETLWSAGYAAHPVGGCVRDTLLGRVPGDWDVTTSALPETVMTLFQKVIPTGIRHGTVTVLLGGMSLEVTTFRREEGYADGRHPDAVRFDAGLAEDLARRDFTVNAMALGRGGEVIDPFGGQTDLERKLIRCVGEADRRFREDALRMFRAVRFAAQLGFSIEGETLDAIRRSADRAGVLSAERVRAEVEKTLLSKRPELAALPVELGMLARFGAAAARQDLSALREVDCTPEARWRVFCALTGLKIELLPVERSLRRAVLRPELRELAALAITGGDLYALGYRGGKISELRGGLLDHVRAHPEDNEKERLVALLKE
ncbi:MAG: tRNA nucleotidyltransferase [Clostridia bacterium]|nr:tRNA nucleotidyltransferase [Clostridia bacterium]